MNCRGRWKRDKKQVDTYIDISLPFPDAKVAAALCVGGPIKYEVMSGSNVTDTWIVDVVMMQTKQNLIQEYVLF